MNGELLQFGKRLLDTCRCIRRRGSTEALEDYVTLCNEIPNHEERLGREDLELWCAVCNVIEAMGPFVARNPWRIRSIPYDDELGDDGTYLIAKLNDLLAELSRCLDAQGCPRS